MEQIGQTAFAYCHSLTSISIPASVTTIGDGAFRNCFKLTEVTIADGVQRIGKRTFAYCKALSSLSLPQSVRTMGEASLYGCNMSKNDVTYPAHLKNLVKNWFNKTDLLGQ